MKKTVLFLAVFCLCFSGCALQRVVEIDPQSRTVTKYTGVAFLNRSALEGLAVGKKTKNASALLSVKAAATETQTEAFQALGEALGAGLVAGAKGAAVP